VHTGPAAVADITAGNSVTLLPGGWHGLETDAGHSFRWVENEAAFTLPAGANPLAYVELDLESGLEFLLRVRCEGRCEERCEQNEQRIYVRERQSLTLALPLRLKSESRYVLHADGGYLSSNGGRRTKFRVFRLANRADIVTLQSGVDLLEGWEPITDQDGERRRVARTGAKLRLHSVRECPVLAADLDPGTAPAIAGLRIDLRDEGGETLFTTGIRSRHVVLMRLSIGA